jgi:hypothetical protein
MALNIVDEQGRLIPTAPPPNPTPSTAPYFYETRTFPSQIIQPGGGINPNLLSMLAGIGAEMDPKGAGGIIGRAGQQYIRAQTNQDLAAKMLAGREQDRRELREEHKRLLERMLPATPPGTAGLNSFKLSSNGSMDFDVDTGDINKLVADLGNYTPQGSPGVNSVTRTKNGSFLINVDPPSVPRLENVADEIDDFSPSNLYKTGTSNAPLSYAPIDPNERLNEMADLMQTRMPPSLTAAMRTPQVRSISSRAPVPNQVAELTEQPSPRRSLR